MNRQLVSIFIGMLYIGIGNFLNAIDPGVHEIVAIAKLLMLSFDDLPSSKLELNDSASNLRVEDDKVILIDFNLHI